MLKRLAKHILRTELAISANKEIQHNARVHTLEVRQRILAEGNDILERQNKELANTNETQLTVIDALSAKLANTESQHKAEQDRLSKELSDAKKVPSPAMSELCHTCLKQQPKTKGK